jgi:DNA repair exonuclease SbcCD ATPase subunit
LEAENLKRLYAVDITPEGDVIEISGANANGKTSTLDAIWWALAGVGTIQSEPIRRGAERASIKLDLGELIVTRTFKRQGDDKFTTSVKVEGADGSSYKSPQTMLDALLSSLTFDPLEFSRKKPKEQFDMLRGFVPGIDFEKVDNQNRGDFERRAEANKRMEEAKAAAGLIEIPGDLPEDETDESKLLDDIAGAAQFNSDIEKELNRRNNVISDVARLVRTADERRKEAADLRAKAEQMETVALSLDRQVNEQREAVQALPPLEALKDVKELRAGLTQTQALNARIRTASEARRKKSSLEKVATDAALKSDELSASIKARTKAKNDAIAAAEMPVDGLGFGDGFITLNGLPFDQASSAEQLKASIAIAMRSNSKLRVIRIRDGGLLDQESFALLTAMAAENECQVWVESVFAHSDSALVISDGRVKAATEEAA